MNKSLKEIAVEVHTLSVKNGFWEDYVVNRNIDFENDLEIRVGLLHSECSEAFEAIRKNLKTSEHVPEISAVEEEIADLIIRSLDMSQGYQWDVYYYNELNKYNLSNLPKHPNYDTEFAKILTIGEKRTQAVLINHLHFLCSKINEGTPIIELSSLIYVTLAYSYLFHWNIEKAVELKHKFNCSRPYMHGGKAF